MLWCGDMAYRDQLQQLFAADDCQTAILDPLADPVAQVRDFAPHLVLVDLSGADHEEQLVAMGRAHTRYDTPFFVITESTDTRFLKGLFAYGVVDFVGRDLSAAILRLKLMPHLQHFVRQQQEQQGELRFKAIFEHAANGMALLGVDGQVLKTNTAFDFIIGDCRTGDPGFGQKLFHSQQDNPSFALLQRGEIDAYISECQLHRCGGEDFCARVVFSAIRQSPNQPPHTILVTLEDVTQERQKAVRLQMSARVFETASEAIIITDAKVNILEVNDAFTAITGYGREDVVGKNPRVLQSGRQGAEFYQAMWRELKARGNWQGEIWNRRKNGEVYPEMLSINAVHDERGELVNYVAVFSDITHFKDSERRLAYMAQHDPLTGLPNRVLLNDRLQHAINFAHRNQLQLAVLYLDLDGFKHINDSYGHPVGDLVLEQVAQRLAGSIRENDTIARIGGDEFVVLLEYVESQDDIEVVAEKIKATLCRPADIDNRLLSVGVSIGIAVYPQDGDNQEQLLALADKAMYQAKQEEGTCHVYYRDLEHPQGGYSAL